MSSPIGLHRFLLVITIISTVALSISNQSINDTNFADSQHLSNPFPYFFPEVMAPSSQLFAMPLCYGFKLEEASIDDLQKAMSNGSLTSVQIVTCYMQRAFQTGEYIK